METPADAESTSPSPRDKTSSEPVEHEDLMKVCTKQNYMHNRANCYIPLGSVQLQMLQGLSHGRLLWFHLMTLCSMGAQPLVLRELPPLAKLLLLGCGVKNNEKHSAKDHPLLSKGWVLTYDLMMFYMAVLQSNAVFSKRNTADVSAKSGALEQVTRHMAATQFQMLCANGILGASLDAQKLKPAEHKILNEEDYKADPRLAAMWDDLDKALRTGEPKSTEDSVPPPLLVLAGAMATRQSAHYTIELIHKMETAIWINIALKAPQGQQTGLIGRVAFWTPRELLCTVGEFPEADRQVREYGVLRQSQALRQMACGDQKASQFKQWPTVTIPSHDKLTLMHAPIRGSDQCSPLDSACYAVLSFYYAGLCLAAPRIGAAQPDVVAATGEQ